MLQQKNYPSKERTTAVVNTLKKVVAVLQDSRIDEFANFIAFPFPVLFEIFFAAPTHLSVVSFHD